MTVTVDDGENSTLGSRSFGGAAELTQAKIRLPRLVTAGEELESLCRSELESQEATDLHSRQSDSDDAGGARNASAIFRGFPRLCLPIVKMLAGNHCCVDCGDEDGERLEYASLGYGTLLCQDCAYRHQTNTFAVSIQPTPPVECPLVLYCFIFPSTFTLSIEFTFSRNFVVFFANQLRWKGVSSQIP